MSQENDRTDFELRNFEKNRYFRGKLMTARDMHVEQEYHTNRTQTTNRLISGAGIVSGLTVSEFEDHGDALRVTIEPGVAIDGTGRPIVVPNATTTRLPAPDGGELYLHLSYDEEAKDPVPVPGGEPLSGEASRESRVLEVFEITYTETPPSGYKETAMIDFPEIDRGEDADPQDVADRLVEAYHERVRTGLPDRTDGTVFLGSFKRTPDGDWQRGSETRKRPFVYDNDMLYSLLLNHITDTTNPHRTTAGEPTEYIESELDQVEGFAVRLEQMHARLETLTRELETHTTYTTKKSLKSTVRFFNGLATTFETDGEISRLAFGIAQRSRRALADEEFEERYIGVVRALLEDMNRLADLLEGEVTELSHDQYVSAVADLEELTADDRETDPSTLEIAVALDQVSEAADLVEKRYGIVPEEEL